ncbi:hypothetical protein OESDEN_15913 [Oesophagostomum dentatum]|uniref:Uncharacterized protein n=1 Tax=Oesophagostomum dentatum TaxID=61180 RepID=A0A0B1SMC5_OESDE|nr:hypothetical protein OESDEN_15913 [Oesophagostomum dentatum]
MSFSIALLFNVAVDRLMSLYKVYHGISNEHKSLYVVAQIFIATAFSTFMTVLVYVSRRKDR